MAEREHKSLDDFFAKRDKKKKKDKGRGGKAPPVKAVVVAAPPQPQPPPPPPPPTPPVAEPEALPAQPAPASAPQHDQVQAQAPAPAPAPAQDAAPDAEQGQAQAQAQAEGAEQGPQLNPPPPAAAAAAAVTTAPAPAPATGGVRKPRKERERLAKGENQDPMQERPREDEEWKEFEQKEVDYSGLRIHALQISDEREEEDEKKEDQDEDGENVSYREGDRTIGPWNKITPAQAPVAVVEEVPEVKPTGVYRPPGARLGNARRTQSQGPPEIFNDVQFPSLQASAKHVETRKDKEMEKTFEMVKYKNRAREDGAKSQSVQLELGNQFAVLEEQ